MKRRNTAPRRPVATTEWELDRKTTTITRPKEPLMFRQGLFDDLVKRCWAIEKKENKWLAIGYPLAVGIVPRDGEIEVREYYYLDCKSSGPDNIITRWYTRDEAAFEKFWKIMRRQIGNYSDEVMESGGAPNENMRFYIDLTDADRIDQWKLN